MRSRRWVRCGTRSTHCPSEDGSADGRADNTNGDGAYREVLNPTKEPVALADYNHGLKHERNTGVQGVLVLGDRKDAEVGEPILKSVEFAAGKWAGRKVLREGAT